MQNFFKPKSLKDALRNTVAMTLMYACTLSAFAQTTSSSGASTTDLTGLTNIVCTISNVISGPYLYGIGIVLVVLGGVAIASAESTIAKFASGALMGLGIASVAVPIMKDHLNIAASC
jgi:type IV secretory pathway VirB2 component (pilin)